MAKCTVTAKVYKRITIEFECDVPPIDVQENDKFRAELRDIAHSKFLALAHPDDKFFEIDTLFVSYKPEEQFANTHYNREE